jgi:TonB family protein
MYFFSVLLSSLLLSFAHGARAQTSEADLNHRLVGKPLYIRGFWGDDTLHFDSIGQLIGRSDRIPFTLSGIDIEGSHLERDALILDGYRVGLKFKDNRSTRIKLKLGPHAPLGDEQVRIIIDRPANGDFKLALDRVFAEDLSDADLVFPTYWQRYVHENLFPPDSPTSQATVEEQPAAPKRIGGAVKPPKLLKSVEPQFSQAAKNLKEGGNVMVNVYLGEDGKPYHFSIVRPAGLGLDEQALAAVRRYTFKPATENGRPIAVELNIEVAFRVF